MTANKNMLVEAICQTKERLQANVAWYPVPALISFGLVLVLSGNLLPRMNPRLGHPAQLLEFNSSSSVDGSIWLSVSIIGQEVVVTTSDRQVFRWPLKLETDHPLNAFRQYMAQTAKDRIRTATLARNISAPEVSAIIAADQHLRFVHIRPIITIFAEVGISTYAFETRLRPIDPVGGSSHG